MSGAEAAGTGLLLLSPRDSVCVACRSFSAGARVQIDGRLVTLREAVGIGFKVARDDIARGDRILKYGAPIGSATRDIPMGAVIHLHKMKSDYIPTHTRDGRSAGAWLPQG